VISSLIQPDDAETIPELELSMRVKIKIVVRLLTSSEEPPLILHLIGNEPIAVLRQTILEALRERRADDIDPFL